MALRSPVHARVGYTALPNELVALALGELTAEQFRLLVGLFYDAEFKADGSITPDGRWRVAFGEVLVSYPNLAERYEVTVDVIRRALRRFTAFGITSRRAEPATPSATPSATEAATLPATSPATSAATPPTIVNLGKWAVFLGSRSDPATSPATSAATPPATPSATSPATEPASIQHRNQNTNPNTEEKLPRAERSGPLSSDSVNSSEPEEAFAFWKREVWPAYSDKPCPKPTKAVMTGLARRCTQYGLTEVTSAMERLKAQIKTNSVKPQFATLQYFANSGFDQFLAKEPEPESDDPIMAAVKRSLPKDDEMEEG